MIRRSEGHGTEKYITSGSASKIIFEALPFSMRFKANRYSEKRKRRVCSVKGKGERAVRKRGQFDKTEKKFYNTKTDII